MATQIPNMFTTYQLTENEQLQGMVLNEQQIHFLQNERSSLAEERNALTIDPNDIYTSVQAEAAIIGKLELLSWLLECSDSANLQLNNPEYDSENP